MIIRAHRFVAAGALAVAAVAAPIAIGLTSVDANTQVAMPKCTAWLGDGTCIAYADQPSFNIGTPNSQVATGNARTNGGSGIGVSTGPLGPGTTISEGIG